MLTFLKTICDAPEKELNTATLSSLYIFRNPDDDCSYEQKALQQFYRASVITQYSLLCIALIADRVLATVELSVLLSVRLSYALSIGAKINDLG